MTRRKYSQKGGKAIGKKPTKMQSITSTKSPKSSGVGSFSGDPLTSKQKAQGKKTSKKKKSSKISYPSKEISYAARAQEKKHTKRASKAFYTTRRSERKSKKAASEAFYAKRRSERKSKKAASKAVRDAKRSRKLAAKRAQREQIELRKSSLGYRYTESSYKGLKKGQRHKGVKLPGGTIGLIFLLILVAFVVVILFPMYIGGIVFAFLLSMAINYLGSKQNRVSFLDASVRSLYSWGYPVGLIYNAVIK